MSAFDDAFACVAGAEGGFTDDPRDPGNWTGGAVGAGECRGTNWGISAAAFPGRDIRALTRADAAGLYRALYWAPLHADALPPPLALLVFDAAVNNGPGRAAQWLQQALGVAADGEIGPATLHAAAAADADAACTEMLARRVAYMAALPDWPVYGLGWARRLCALPFHAARLAA